jgi:predicted transposase YbfD/YdcC
MASPPTIPSGPGALQAGFAALDPDPFQACCLAWVRHTVVQTEGAVIACDGKPVRRSHDRAAGKGPVYMVSAWASANRLVLGQIAVDEKSNEITALPGLLDLLMLKGCIVTIDVMGRQTAIARTIIDREADYVLALKENQETIYREVVHLFADEHDAAETVDGGHSRVGIRRYRTISDPATLTHLDPDGAWAGLHAIGIVTAERREKGQGGKVTHETRCYLTSLTDTATFGRAVRGHWGIENGLHWAWT